MTAQQNWRRMIMKADAVRATHTAYSRFLRAKRAALICSNGAPVSADEIALWLVKSEYVQ